MIVSYSYSFKPTVPINSYGLVLAKDGRKFYCYISLPSQNAKSMANHRRSFLRQVGGISLFSLASPVFNPLLQEKVTAAVALVDHLSPEEAAMDEDFWFSISQAYSSSPNYINLNNGGVSPQPVVVQDALDRYNRLSNEGPAYYMWQVLKSGKELIREKLSKLAGCSTDEISICRNATEALNTVIFGLDLKKGDEILTSDQDYPNMMNALEQRKQRDGIVVTKVKLPVPAEDANEIVSIYEKAIRPGTRYILVSHVVFLTGQILPIKAICRMARQKGVGVIVDGAHSFGHLDFNIPDLDCDYFGTSLHKWLSAPFGSGMLYIKKDKVADVWPLLGAPGDFDRNDIRKFEHLGTRSIPTEMAIGQAVDFHNGIGSARKEARLRYLKNYWAEKVRAHPGVKLNTSMKSEFSCGIGNFNIPGKDLHKIYQYIKTDRHFYCTRINHDDVNGIRITPQVYTTLKDLDLFAGAVKDALDRL